MLWYSILFCLLLCIHTVLFPGLYSSAECLFWNLIVYLCLHRSACFLVARRWALSSWEQWGPIRFCGASSVRTLPPISSKDRRRLKWKVHKNNRNGRNDSGRLSCPDSTLFSFWVQFRLFDLREVVFVMRGHSSPLFTRVTPVSQSLQHTTNRKYSGNARVQLTPNLGHGNLCLIAHFSISIFFL